MRAIPISPDGMGGFVRVCSTCHISKALTAYGANGRGGTRTICQDCRAIQRAEYFQTNKKRISETHAPRRRSWYAANKERVAAHGRLYRERKGKGSETERQKKWRQENLERCQARERAFRLANRERENRRQREWCVKNPHLLRQKYARRRDAQRSSTPPWLSREQEAAITAFYAEAIKRTASAGIPYHVDHIYPLIGKNEQGFHVSCGLHVPWNLQVISKSENSSKGCRNPIQEAA